MLAAPVMTALGLRILSLFRFLRRAFEIEPEAVGIRHRGHPEAVADERPRGLDRACAKLAVERAGVVAHDADRNPIPDLAGGPPAVMAFGRELLQHQRNLAPFEPAP